MKLFLSFCFSAFVIFALCEAGPARRRFKFTSGNSGTSGRAGGDETSVDTESKVQAGDEKGAFAETLGRGTARGQKESRLELESWAGFEGQQTAGAGGEGKALGDETFVEADSDVFIGEGTGLAKATNRGGARGKGKTAIDLETFGSLDGWSSGSAGVGARADGEESEIDSEASVHSEFGLGTHSKSGSQGAAWNNNGLAVLDLENFAAVDEANSDALAAIKAIGNDVRGHSRSSSLHGADGEDIIESEAEAIAEANGKGGVRITAESFNDGLSVKSGADARGQGDHVITGGNAMAGLTNTKSAGKTESFAKSSGRGSSYAESGASVVFDEEKSETQQPQDCQNHC